MGCSGAKQTTSHALNLRESCRASSKCQIWNKHNTYIQNHTYTNLHRFWKKSYKYQLYRNTITNLSSWLTIDWGGPQDKHGGGLASIVTSFPCQWMFQVASAAWRTVASGNRQTRAPVHRSRWHTNVEFCTKVGHTKCIQMWCRYHIWYLKKFIPTQIKGSVCEMFEKVCSSNTPPCSPWSLRIPCHPGPRITAKRSCSVHRDDARTALSSHVWARPASERVTQAARRQENHVELREL